MKISNFLKTQFFSIVLTFIDDVTLNSDNNKEIWNWRRGLGKAAGIKHNWSPFRTGKKYSSHIQFEHVQTGWWMRENTEEQNGQAERP